MKTKYLSDCVTTVSLFFLLPLSFIANLWGLSYRSYRIINPRVAVGEM
jgi:hypothetical protein